MLLSLWLLDVSISQTDHAILVVRETPARGPRYLSLVESGRAGKRGRPRPRRALGRTDGWPARGERARLSAVAGAPGGAGRGAGGHGGGRAGRRADGGPWWGRRWAGRGGGAGGKELLAGRGGGCAGERAGFVSVLPRLVGAGSARAGETGLADDALAGIEGGGRLHPRDRARAGRGAEREAPAAGALAPRGGKEAGAERLGARRRALFPARSLVFLDTTTRAVPGAGGEPRGAPGPAQAQRPDGRQRVLAGVRDGAGRPVCPARLPGNTAATRGLRPSGDRLRARGGRGGGGGGADRGLLSAATRAALAERGRASLLGARERRPQGGRAGGRKDAKPFGPLLIERGRGAPPRFGKAVPGGGARASGGRNEAEAQKGPRRPAGRGGRPAAAPRRAPLPGPAHGGRPVPPANGPGAPPPARPLRRRRAPRPRLLLLPRPRPPHGTGRPLPHRRRRGRLGRSAPRPRPPASGPPRAGRPAHHRPPPCRGPGRQGLPGPRHRASPQLARTPSRIPSTINAMSGGHPATPVAPHVLIAYFYSSLWKLGLTQRKQNCSPCANPHPPNATAPRGRHAVARAAPERGEALAPPLWSGHGRAMHPFSRRRGRLRTGPPRDATVAGLAHMVAAGVHGAPGTPRGVAASPACRGAVSPAGAGHAHQASRLRIFWCCWNLKVQQ